MIHVSCLENRREFWAASQGEGHGIVQREPAPAMEQRRQEPFFLNLKQFFFGCFEEEMGTFHVGVVCSQKNSCSLRVVERKRCPSACFWSGSALQTGPCGFALLMCGVTHVGTKGKVIVLQPVQFLENKLIL